MISLVVYHVCLVNITLLRFGSALQVLYFWQSWRWNSWIEIYLSNVARYGQCRSLHQSDWIVESYWTWDRLTFLILPILIISDGSLMGPWWIPDGSRWTVRQETKCLVSCPSSWDGPFFAERLGMAGSGAPGPGHSQTDCDKDRERSTKCQHKQIATYCTMSIYVNLAPNSNIETLVRVGRFWKPGWDTAFHLWDSGATAGQGGPARVESQWTRIKKVTESEDLRQIWSNMVRFDLRFAPDSASILVNSC